MQKAGNLKKCQDEPLNSSLELTGAAISMEFVTLVIVARREEVDTSQNVIKVHLDGLIGGLRC